MSTSRRVCLYAVILASLSAPGCGRERPVKIYVMAGQSNMVGPGQNSYVQANAPELMTPRDDVWCTCPGRLAGPLKPGYGFRSESFGPELTFGHVMGDAVEDDIIIIKSGRGGTTLHVDWRPPSAVRRAGGKVGPLYNKMIRAVHSLIANLGRLNPRYEGRPYELAGLVWFQGENDSCGRTAEKVGYWTFYRENLQDFLKDVRGDLGAADLPVVIAQINDGVWDGGNRGGPQVRAAQKYVADHDERVSMIVTRDLNAGYHYDSASHLVIGRRMAKAMLPYSARPVRTDPAAVRGAGQAFMRRNYAPGTPDVSSLRKGLVGYWKCDEGTGSVTADASPGGNTGTLKGGPTWTTGLFGSAVRLTGTQSIDIPGFTEPLGAGKTIENLTVSFWIRTPSSKGINRVGKGLGKPIERNNKNWFIGERANAAGWELCNFDVDGFPCFTAALDGAGARTAYSNWGEPTISADGFEWRHVVALYDGTSRSMLMYADGRLAKNVVRDAGGNHITAARTVLQIGGGPLETGSFQVFDEVAVWSRPLTPGEVRALYNNGAGVEIIRH